MTDRVESRTPTRAADERFKQLAENVREIFWVYDPAAGRVVYVNPAYEAVTGRSAERLYQNPSSWLEAVEPGDRPRVEETVRTGADVDHNIEFRLLRPDGQVHWIWARGLPVRNERGRVELIVGAAEDITERKRAETALEESVSLLRATLDATTDGILALDRDGRITTFNRRFVELLRIPDFVAIESGREAGLWTWIMDQLEDPEAFQAGMNAARDQPETDTQDVIGFRDGRVFERQSRPQRSDEEVVGRVWSFRDATARTRAERSMRRRTGRLEVQNKVLLRLTRQRIRTGDDLQEALRHIAESAADMIETERVGIWLFEAEHERIRLTELYERGPRRHSRGQQMRRSDSPAYFEALEQERALAAHDARNDPRTARLTEQYMAPAGITSMLDAPIRAAGELVGVICFEHVGPPRRWSVEDESFAGSAGDLVAIAVESADRQRAEWGLRCLLQASTILTSSLDYRSTLSDLAARIVPGLADWCVIDLVENGQARPAAQVHRDGKDVRIQELERRYPAEPGSPHPAARALHEGEPVLVPDLTDAELRAVTRDGEHRRLIRELGARSYMAVPLAAAGHRLGALTLVSATRGYDATDLELAREIAGRAAVAVDHARLYERAQTANKAKSDFLAVMSHELRTPLSAIMGYVDLIEAGVSGPITDRQREQLERIRLRSQDLLRIIEEILAFSRTETGIARARFETVDLAALVREVAAVARPMAEERGLEFRLDAPDGPVHFATDGEKLKHILLDLLSNAVKFTERGVVELGMALDGQRAVLTVRDTGAGIAPEDQDRIFQPFVQIEEAMTREKEGTGLGLAVVRRLSRLLGGDVSVDSEPGRGSTFTVTLPTRAGSREEGR